MNNVVITPDGYIKMSQVLQKKFIADIAGLSQSSMKTSTDFASIVAELKAIKKAVDTANPNSGNYRN